MNAVVVTVAIILHQRVLGTANYVVTALVLFGGEAHSFFLLGLFL